MITDRIREAGPVWFAKNILGLTLWEGQERILNAVATCPRVAVRSGHKIGKSTSAAVAALWDICSDPISRVILTASSTRQVESVVWREIKLLHRNAKVPIGGKMLESAAGGLKMRSGAEITGFATTDTERMAGFSGRKVRFIVDEASGVPDSIFEAIRGNTAGGASIFATGNPTRTSGFFFRAFHEDAHAWRGLHITSKECAEATKDWPRSGLATLAWVEECAALYGVDSPEYRIRVLGEFVELHDRKLIPKKLVLDAMARIGRVGELSIGLDLARFGDDASVIAVRRGDSIVEIIRLRKMDGPSVRSEVVRAIRNHGGDKQTPVFFDVSGIGQGAAGFLAESREFHLVEVDSSAVPRNAQYVRARDEMLFQFRDWLDHGGSLPQDHTLVEDLGIPSFGIDERNRLFVESKKIIRKRIGRSTDVLDACALAVCGAWRGAGENWSEILGV